MKNNIALIATSVFFILGLSLQGKPNDQTNDLTPSLYATRNTSRLERDTFLPKGTIGSLEGKKEWGWELSEFKENDNTRSLALVVSVTTSLKGWFQHLVATVKSEPIKIKIDKKTGKITLSPEHPQGSTTHRCWTLGTATSGFSVIKGSGENLDIRIKTSYENDSRGKNEEEIVYCIRLDKK